MQLTASAPANIAAVINCPDVRIYSSWYVSGQTWTFSSPVRPNKVWALIGSPAGTVDEGCYGEFQLVAFPASSVVASIPMVNYLLEFEVEVRGRN